MVILCVINPQTNIIPELSIVILIPKIHFSNKSILPLCSFIVSLLQLSRIIILSSCFCILLSTVVSQPSLFKVPFKKMCISAVILCTFLSNSLRSATSGQFSHLFFGSWSVTLPPSYQSSCLSKYMQYIHKPDLFSAIFSQALLKQTACSVLSAISMQSSDIVNNLLYAS